MSTEPEKKRYEIPMRMVFEKTFFVEAFSADEAASLAEELAHESESEGELVDWEVRGDAKEIA